MIKAKTVRRLALLVLGGSIAAGPGAISGMLARQKTDPGFNAHVARPAYVNQHPRVLFDEAHNNADTSGGRYKPFVDLIRSDGYRVVANNQRFSRTVLNRYEVLVIVNASGPGAHRDAPAFTDVECDAVRDWVRSGGAVLLISDHAPFSAAVSSLSQRLGVEFTKGFTIDPVHHNKDSGDETELVFNRDNGLLAGHAITRGRNATEEVSKVMTFSGTSVNGPPGSVAFLKLADTAVDVIPFDYKPTPQGDPAPDAKRVSAAGRAQGLALGIGRGRLIVLGEAAMLTAQVAPGGFPFGMNFPGVDNRQLSLNIMHWLSGLLK